MDTHASSVNQKATLYSIVHNTSLEKTKEAHFLIIRCIPRKDEILSYVDRHEFEFRVVHAGDATLLESGI